MLRFGHSTARVQCCRVILHTGMAISNVSHYPHIYYRVREPVRSFLYNPSQDESGVADDSQSVFGRWGFTWRRECDRTKGRWGVSICIRL